jgi:hypothetical protein
MTGTDYTLFTHKSVPVIFEPPCMNMLALSSDLDSAQNPRVSTTKFHVSQEELKVK